MMERALMAGVRRMILPSVSRASYERMERCEALYPDRLFISIGLHPTDVGADYQEELSFVRQKLSERSFVALGEIGLDYYWDTTFREEQKYAFHEQMKLASQYDLPIIIHTRSAWADTFTALREESPLGLRGVFHCFTGEEAELEECLSFERFMIALGGVVTFKNSKLRDYVGRIPLDRLLIETDAPYLAPVPHRGKRNEPAFLPNVVEHLAPLWGLTPQELAEATTANAEALFGLAH